MMLEPAQPLPRRARTNYQLCNRERSGDGQFLPINILCSGNTHAVPSGDQHPFDQYVFQNGTYDPLEFISARRLMAVKILAYIAPRTSRGVQKLVDAIGGLSQAFRVNAEAKRGSPASAWATAQWLNPDDLPQAKVGWS
jgi:hypothetical protein